MRYLILIVSLFFIFSCTSKPVEFQYNTDNNQAYTISTSPNIIIKSPEKTEFDVSYITLLKIILSEFKKIAPHSADTIFLEFENADWDFYDLYYQLGGQYFKDYKNAALLMGMLQKIWIDISLDNKYSVFISHKVLPLKYYIIGIEEFDTLFKKYSLDEQGFRDLYEYVNKYLLEQILFVSVQELMESPYKYFQGSFYKSIFTHAVILPEMTEFYSYILRIYGKRRVLNCMSVEYSRENWKKIFHEEINETENNFRIQIEDQKYEGIYNNPQFLEELNVLLKLYNTSTKATLFSK